MGGRRFTKEEIACITDMYRRGLPQREIAMRFDRSQTAISDVLARTGTIKRPIKETRALRWDGTLNETQNILLGAICMECEKTTDNICYLTNDELAELVGVSNISSDLTVLTRKGFINRETILRNGFGGGSTRKIWMTENGTEYLAEYRKSRKKNETETIAMPTSENATTDATAILNDILQELKHLSKRMDEIAQIGYDQRDREIVYAKAQLDKLSSISAALHKED